MVDSLAPPVLTLKPVLRFNGDPPNPGPFSSVTPNPPSGTHLRQNTDVLGLPPAAFPYVLVLAGVPTLKKEQRETWDQLHNKCVDWLSKNKQFYVLTTKELIMVQRVGRVGDSPKNIDGDIVINFRSLSMVRTLLRKQEILTPSLSKIWSLPLGYFYKPTPKCLPCGSAPPSRSE